MPRAALARTLLAVALALGSGAAEATTVLVMSIASGRADLLVNGSALRSVVAGQVTPEGIRVLEIGRDSALLEVDGRRWSMRIGSSTIASVVLQADPRGHFFVETQINGLALRALVDTGATTVALSLADAQRARVDLSRAQRITMMTAGGPRPAWATRLASVRIGDIQLANVEAAVHEGNDLPVVLLGMSFLNQVEMQRSGSSLTLTLRH